MSGGKRGGSKFSAFALERFGYQNATASHWAIIGQEAAQLRCITTKFAPDWFAMYQFTRLPDDLKARAA